MERVNLSFWYHGYGCPEPVTVSFPPEWTAAQVAEVVGILTEPQARRYKQEWDKQGRVIAESVFQILPQATKPAAPAYKAPWPKAQPLDLDALALVLDAADGIKTEWNATQDAIQALRKFTR